jgi:hypothetical protein
MNAKKKELGYYNLFLPVFKQGDDLHGCLDANQGDGVKGFLDLAETYDGAAQICREIADALKAAKKNYHVHADTHYIGLELPDNIAEPLLTKGLLQEEEKYAEDDEEYDDEELDDGGPDLTW